MLLFSWKYIYLLLPCWHSTFVPLLLLTFLHRLLPFSPFWPNLNPINGTIYSFLLLNQVRVFEGEIQPIPHFLFSSPYHFMIYFSFLAPNSLSLAVLWRSLWSELFGPSSVWCRDFETRRGRAASDIKFRGQHAIPSNASECGIPTIFPSQRTKLSNTSKTSTHEETIWRNNLYSKNGITSPSIGTRELCDTWHVGDAVTSEIREQWTSTHSFSFVCWESELWVQPGT